MNMTAYAPVLIFAYRRPAHLAHTLDHLMWCDGFDKSPVIVYCDGARCPEEQAVVKETQSLARKKLGDRAEYHVSETNQGLAASVIAGVTDVVGRFGRVIVVEDDLHVFPCFLRFMNQALERYAEQEQVFQISGYMFDVPALRTASSALFLPLTVSWGWATWQRAWDRFDPGAEGWDALYKDRQLRYRFNLEGSYDYSGMLIRQMTGMQDSWAIRWYWTVFRAGGLVLFPPVSLVKNTGFDGSGTHGRGILCRFSPDHDPALPDNIMLPHEAGVKDDLFATVKKAVKRQSGGRLGGLAKHVRRLLGV